MAKTVMKLAELLLVSFVFYNFANAKQLIRLNSGVECPEPGYFRDVVNCRKFYYCPNIPNKHSVFKGEELRLMREITEKGLECPEGTIFDETEAFCQNIFLMSVIPPECKPTHLLQSYLAMKDGEVQEISDNRH